MRPVAETYCLLSCREREREREKQNYKCSKQLYSTSLYCNSRLAIAQTTWFTVCVCVRVYVCLQHSPFGSTSFTIFFSSASVGFKPRARITSPIWLASILLSPRLSNKAKASWYSVQCVCVCVMGTQVYGTAWFTKANLMHVYAQCIVGILPGS